jgi:Lon protease-like protein
MPERAVELPLFPLSVVLFPGMVLPLHIFEPRYRQMIADCQQQKPFGVVLARPKSLPLQEEPYPVGTMAEIRDLHTLPDGRSILMAFGKQRFRILSQHRLKPYLSGMVEPYSDVLEARESLLEPAKQARGLFSTYLNMLLEAANEAEQEIHASVPDDPEELSHFIAYFLEVPNEQKQRLLELTSTRQRLLEVAAILRREVPFMRQILSSQIDKDHSRLN